MLSPQSQLLERNLDLFNDGSWLFINPTDAYFADRLSDKSATFLHQYFDIFSESVRVIPSWEFNSQDIASSVHGFTVSQKIGHHQHHFAPFIPVGETFSDIMIYLPKSKMHMKMLLSMACAALAEGGRIHVVGENKGGIKSVGKLLADIGENEKIDSARHCSLVTVHPDAYGTSFDVSTWLSFSTFSVNDYAWNVESLPGVFSHSELDEGTRMLLEKTSAKLKGKVLDFACGAGVIGSHLLKRFPHLDIVMSDVSALAIYCTARTLTANKQQATLIAANGLHGVERKFSHIVTNPPFHTGVKTDLTITQHFISDAKRCLPSNGTLLLVANRFLSYPNLLDEHFHQVRTVAQDNRFSLYLAIS